MNDAIIDPRAPVIKLFSSLINIVLGCHLHVDPGILTLIISSITLSTSDSAFKLLETTLTAKSE